MSRSKQLYNLRHSQSQTIRLQAKEYHRLQSRNTQRQVRRQHLLHQQQNRELLLHYGLRYIQHNRSDPRI